MAERPVTGPARVLGLALGTRLTLRAGATLVLDGELRIVVDPGPFADLAQLGAALAAGLVIAFLGSQLRPVFTDANELRMKTGLPLLGVISMSLSDAERRQERLGLIRFFGASAGLVGIFVVGLIAMAILARQAG